MRSIACLSISPICKMGHLFLSGGFFLSYPFLSPLFDLIESPLLPVLFDKQFHISDPLLNFAREGCRSPVETQIDPIVK